jgi:hypothetical protein
MVIKANSHFLTDNHPKSLKILQDWCEGYTLFEIASRNDMHIGVTSDALKFTFELLGRKLQISDGSVLNMVHPQLQAAAHSVFRAYYDTFTELPERDMELN